MADALNPRSRPTRRRPDWILTPHPGEAARLSAAKPAACRATAWDQRARIAEKFGGVCVLKGRTRWSTEGGAALGLRPRQSRMATAGSGDVLTGIVASLLAGGAPPPLAAAAGVLLHAEAGDRAHAQAFAA
jgi:NAD(P)H-hydrate epimerase